MSRTLRVQEWRGAHGAVCGTGERGYGHNFVVRGLGEGKRLMLIDAIVAVQLIGGDE